MLGTLVKMLSYTQAPKAMFAVRHPGPALKLKALPYEMKHGYAPRLVAMGTAAVVLPLGMWIGRRMGSYPERYREILARNSAARPA